VAEVINLVCGRNGGHRRIRCSRGVPDFQEFDKMEAAGAADRFAHLTRLQPWRHLDEQTGQLFDRTPAEIAAFQSLLTGGNRYRHLFEVGPLAQLLQHIPGLLLSSFHL